MDASDPRAETQIQVVRDVLESLHAGGTPALLVYNKTDRLETVPANTPQAVYISAKEQLGLGGLLERVEEMLRPRMMELTLDLGYDEGANWPLFRSTRRSFRWNMMNPACICIYACLPLKPASCCIDIKILLTDGQARGMLKRE